MTVKAQATLLLMTVLGCATAKAPQRLQPSEAGYVAPSDRTIVGEVDPTFDSQEIYITNNSSAPIVVTGVQVYDCVNATPCALLPVQIQVAPGQRRRVAAVRPVNGDEAYSYRYRWTWSGLPGR